jgi:N-acetylmuramoyl-L-alanine amidase
MNTWTGANRNNYMKGRTWKGVTYTPQVIVLHWMAGTLKSTDKTFQNPLRQASAHFGVGGDGTVHQYVAVGDTAYHSGNWWVNLKSIGIEHEGNVGIPITEATYKASAELLAQICIQFQIEPSEETFIPHRKVMATACPGTLDIPRLISIVKGIMHPSPVDQPLNPPPIEGTVASAPAPVQHFVVQVTNKGGLKVRVSPNHLSEDVPAKFLHFGDKLTIKGTVQGSDPYGDGRNIWLHTYVSGLYIWAGATNFLTQSHGNA